MIRSIILFLLCAWISISCNTNRTGDEVEQNTVEMKQFLLESTPGCNYDSVSCARFEVNYPLFPGLASAVQTKLQEQFNATISSGEPTVLRSIEEEGKEFLDGYAEYSKQAPNVGGGWYRDVAITLILFNDSLLSLQVTDESYSGGAHGNYVLTFINVRPESGTPFLLSDFLKPGYEQDFNKIGEEIFRKNRALADTASLEFNGYTFVNNHFALNNNYGFSQEGISFYFNSYEVAPYVMGPTEVLIPYDRIKEWIK